MYQIIKTLIPIAINKLYSSIPKPYAFVSLLQSRMSNMYNNIKKLTYLFTQHFFKFIFFVLPCYLLFKGGYICYHDNTLSIESFYITVKNNLPFIGLFFSPDN